MSRKKTLHLVSLGCPKNLADSEHFLGLLAEKGWRVEPEAEDAEVIAVNTCAFIQSAVEEAIQVILDLARLKESASPRRLIVFGCLPQRYQNQLKASLPEVDLFWGSGDFDLLARLVDEPGGDSSAEPDWSAPGHLQSEPGPRLRSAPFFRAYLKIAEGCSNRCTYCLIPGLRGPFRSRPLPVLIQEAEALARTGVKELIVVAQDTTAYGQDLEAGLDLALLLKELAQVPDLAWIRLLYAYPSGLTNALLKVLATTPRIVPYLDIPLQHASPNILKRMGRGGRQDLLQLVGKLRQGIPGLVLRTTLMVGFPGETEEDFQTLVDFVEAARFERLGVFKFSPEEGVPAGTFKDQVPQHLKEKRRRRLLAIQRRIARAANRALVGRELDVLVEGPSQETDLLLAGRYYGQAPDIDGVVYINRGRASAGEIHPVRITQAHDYDLVGEIAGFEE